jgi:hypothetical protein
MCKSCYIQSLDQSANFEAMLSCKSNTEIATSLIATVSDKISQELTSNKDVLSGLAQVLGLDSNLKLQNTIVDRVRQQITAKVVTDIKAELTSTSTIEITGSGITVVAASQYSTLRSVLNAVSQNSFTSKLLTESEWEQLQVLHNKQNTLDDVGKILTLPVKAFASLGRLTETVLGKVIIFSLCIVGVLVAVAGILLTYNGYGTWREYFMHMTVASNAAATRPVDPSAPLEPSAPPSAPPG